MQCGVTGLGSLGVCGTSGRLRGRPPMRAMALASLLAAASGGVKPADGQQVPAGQAQRASGFAGSAACLPCHQEQFREWEVSVHGTAGGPPGPETVVAPFGGPPLEFLDATVHPVMDALGRHAFVVARPGRPDVTFLVSGVIGRGHMVGGGTQGFLTRMEDGTERFLPFDYSVSDRAWFCNTAHLGGRWLQDAGRAALRLDAGWQPVTPGLRLTHCGDWPPARILGDEARFANCQGCHGSRIGIEYKSDLGRYETTRASLAIDCESCHGPALWHSLDPEVDGTKMAALDTLDTDASLGVCLGCHALKRNVGFQESSPARGAGGLEPDYSLGLALIGDAPLLPDGRIKTFGYQQNHRMSACYLSGSMSCVDCHDPHSQGYRDIYGNVLATRFDDGQCTSCHASKLADPEAHTMHRAGSPGSACTSCHMPYLQHPELGSAVTYARADHTISIPRPAFDASQGVTSACASCHADRLPSQLDAQVLAWWGVVAPLRGEVLALQDALSPGADAVSVDRALVQASGLGSRHGVSKMAALEAWMRAWIASGGPTGPARDGLEDVAGRALVDLVGDADEDVRAVAAAALHATRGRGAPARALLDDIIGAPASASDGAGARDRMRRRWAAALIQWAGAARAEGGPAAALFFLRRAQEVDPRNPETLTALGVGLSAAGEVDEAVHAYVAALGIAADNPVALTNLGIALEILDRPEDAESVYRDVLRRRPGEALAHMNLGNIHFRRGDYQGAARSYQRAVQSDPGLGRAHLYLAVSLINTQRLDDALPVLHDALEFSVGEYREEARLVLRQLEAALGERDKGRSGPPASGEARGRRSLR